MSGTSQRTENAPMSEQIMWAVIAPSGFIESVCHSETEAKDVVCIGDFGQHMAGYRCIRVRVTEVQDGP